MTVRFRVRLTPRAGAERIDGVGPGGELLARVRAAPAAGAANRALIELLAEALDVPPSAIRLLSGHAGRTKRLLVEGRSAADLRADWPALAAHDS